jgi:hypothetical protein
MVDHSMKALSMGLSDTWETISQGGLSQADMKDFMQDESKTIAIKRFS